MKRRVLMLLLPLACSAALALNARAQDQPQTEKQESQSAEPARQVTVTGCLQGGTEPNSFVLNDAAMASSNLDRDRDSDEPSEMARSDYSYNLIPDGQDLARFVGQKVEVTGPIIAAEQTSSDPGTSETGSKPQLRVKLIRQVSQTCP